MSARREPPRDDQSANLDETRRETASGDAWVCTTPGLPASIFTGGGTIDRDELEAWYRAIEQSVDRGERDEGVGPDSMPRVEFRITRDLKKRIDRYLVDRVPFLSRAGVQRLIEDGAVTLNGRPPKSSTKVRAGDVISTALPQPPSSDIRPEEIPLDVLFEDDDLIVLNKAAGIIVHPARSEKSGTLVNALAWHFLHRTGGELSTVGQADARPGVVHRLDRNTTGAIVAAKRDVAHWRLGRQFETRTTDKRYLALVHGRVEPPIDLVDLPIGKHPTLRERYAVRHDDSARSAQTVYRVREQYESHALVELELRTGRTHQIRVHLSHLGWPIVGDDMYGGRPLMRAQVDDGIERGSSDDGALIDRQALHATTLTIDHPTTEERITFTAPLAPDMRDAIARLRANRLVRALDVPGVTVDLALVAP